MLTFSLDITSKMPFFHVQGRAQKWSPRLREFFWQDEAEVVRNWRNKTHQTLVSLFSPFLYQQMLLSYVPWRRGSSLRAGRPWGRGRCTRWGSRSCTPSRRPSGLQRRIDRATHFRHKNISFAHNVPKNNWHHLLGFDHIYCTQFGRRLPPEMQASSGRKMTATDSRTGYIIRHGE